MTIETNTYASQASEAQVYFDEASMSDAEYEDFIVSVEQENERLFGVDHNSRKVAVQNLSPDEQLSNAVDSREIGDLVLRYAPDSITVLEKYKVCPSVYLETAKRLESIEGCLVAGQEYYPDELIGFGTWVQFPPHLARQFELCLMHFAAMKNHPLEDTWMGSFVWAPPKGSAHGLSACNSDQHQTETREMECAARQFSRVDFGGFL